MIQCPNCGGRIPKTAATCAICGRDVPPGAAELPAPAPTAAPRPASTPRDTTNYFTPAPEPPEPSPPVAPDDAHETSATLPHDDIVAALLDSVDPSDPFYRDVILAMSVPDEAVQSGLVASDAGRVAAIVSEPSTDPEAETDLISLVVLYTGIGGYSGALVGLFTPLFAVLGIIFSLFANDSFWEGIFGIFLYGILGAILWVPASVVLGIIAGIGGLVLGLGVGILASIIYRSTFKNPEALRVSRYLIALLNAVVFGYAAWWGYTHSFIHSTFPEFVLMPIIVGLLGVLSGLAMALFGPEKAEPTEPLSDEDTAEAMKVIMSPFNLWRGVAGRSFGTSVEIIDDHIQRNQAHSLSYAERKALADTDKMLKDMKKYGEKSKEQQRDDVKIRSGTMGWEEYNRRQENRWKE